MISNRAVRALVAFLLLLTLLTRAPALYLLDVLALLVLGASYIWGRYCLTAVAYTRRFVPERVFFGENVEVWVEIVNAKPLPLAWLKAADEVPDSMSWRGVEPNSSSTPHRRELTTVLSLRWYESVRRRYHLVADHRGVFEFGPVTLSSSDLFGFRLRFAEVDQRQTLMVYPKIVPLEQLGFQAAYPLGDFRITRRLITDPLRLAGARDYAPGDSMRHVHWKATARRGTLQTKVFDPSASRHLIIALNGQTLERAYEGIITDYFETAIVVAASIANAATDAQVAVGLFTNSAVRGNPGRVRVPASRHKTQLTRILEALAQLGPVHLAPLEDVMVLEMPLLPYGATIVVISALITEALLATLLEWHDAGHPITLITISKPPPMTVPPEIPVLTVTQNWTELQQLTVTP